MNALWTVLEKVDRAVISSLEKWDSLRKKDDYLTRIQRETEHVRPPQRVLEFDR